MQGGPTTTPFLEVYEYACNEIGLTTGGRSHEINASTKRQFYTFMNDCEHVLQTPFTSVCADNSASID